MGCSLFRYSCSKIFVIPLFLLKNFRYSIIPAQKAQLFHYSKNKISVILIPLFLFSPLHCSSSTPEFNEPLYNEVLGITHDIHQPGQSYSKMYGTEPRYNEILVVTSTIQKSKRKMYLDITNKCQHATEKINAKQTVAKRMRRLSNFCSSFLLLKFC